MRIRCLSGWLVAMALVLGLAAAARAERVDDIPNPRARDRTWVSDATGRLRPETVQQINQLVDALERETTAEIAVVVIRSLDGESIEDVAVRLFRAWGIGKKGQDNGLLLLWAADDRRVRIEVGYGLEGVLPDAKAGAILDSRVLPHFRTGDFDAGVLDGVRTLAAVVRSEPVALPQPASSDYVTSDGLPLDLLGLLGLGTLPPALLGYRWWRRRRRRACPQCGATMTRLPEGSEDEYLDESQRVEEKLRSVDYDVWRCASCTHRFVLRYPRWFTRYDKCPQCGHRTKSDTRKTLESPTTSHAGRARITQSCEFCNFCRTFEREIPRLSSDSSSDSSGGGSGGSSGGGSFGGGSSGGGGASKGY